MKNIPLAVWAFSCLAVKAAVGGAAVAPLPDSPGALLTPAVASLPVTAEPAPAPTRPPLRLTLEEAINVAMQRNVDIATAEDGLAGSRYSLIAAGADYELRITPAGEARVEGGSDEGTVDVLGFGLEISQKFYPGTRISLVPKTGRIGDKNYETSVTAYLAQPLLRGFSVEYNLSGIKAAEFGERTSARSLHLTRVGTVVKTVANVYDIIRNRENLRLNKESVSRLEGYREAARVRERIGIASPIDVYRAEIELNQAVDELNLAREVYMDSVDSLKFLLALPMETNLEVTAPLDYRLLEFDENEAISVALVNRVEIYQAEDNVSESERLTRVAKHEILPELNLQLNYRRSGEGNRFDRSMDFDQDGWGVGLVAGGDIWRTGEKAQYQRSLLGLRTSRRNLVNLRNEIQREVKFELRNLEKLSSSIAIQRDLIHQAESKLELSRIQFSFGRASNFDLIEAERELLRAQSRLLAAVSGYIVGGYRLKAVLGTLIEIPEEWPSS